MGNLLFYNFNFYNWNIRFKGQPALAAVHLNGLPFVKLTRQNLERQRVLQLTLDGPFERTGNEVRVVADLGQMLNAALG